MPAVDIDGLRVEYEDEGTGLPVVFVPGLTGSRSWFRYQTSGLSEHYRIISYDLRSASRREAYTIDLLTEDLARFLSTLKLHSAVIAGHSFGGLVAQSFALAYPQRAKALVLCSTFPCLPPQTPAQNILEWLSPGPVEFESKWAAFWKRLLQRRQPLSEEADSLAWLSRQNAGLNRRTLDARIRLVEQLDLTNRLSEIGMPTLLVVGAEDRASILAGTQMLHQGVADATLEVVEGGDHFVFFTRHDLFNDVVDDFLTDRLASLS